MNKGLIIIAATLLSTQALCASQFYVTGGAGVTVPSGSNNYTADSSSVLYSPTAPGSSLFTLPDVNWKNKFDTGFDLNAAVGYQFTPFFRSDMEFVYQQNKRNITGQYNWREQDASNGSVYAISNNNLLSRTNVTTHLYSLLTNVYYDFQNQSKWTPTIGAGVGVAWVSSDNTVAMNTLNVDDPNTPLVESAPVREISPSLGGTAFAFQFKLGVDYQLNDSTSIAIIYRLLTTSQLRASSSYIISNPGTTAESTFYIAQHNVSGLMTNSLEVSAKFTI